MAIAIKRCVQPLQSRVDDAYGVIMEKMMLPVTDGRVWIPLPNWPQSWPICIRLRKKTSSA
jgi:hypothetical protein